MVRNVLGGLSCAGHLLARERNDKSKIKVLRHFAKLLANLEDGPILCGNLGADTIEAFFSAVGGPSVASFAKLVSTATVPHLASDPLSVQLAVEKAAWSHALSDRLVDTRLADDVAFRLYCVFNRLCDHTALPMAVSEASAESVWRRLGLPIDVDECATSQMRRVRLRFPSGCSTCSNFSDVSLNSSASSSSSSSSASVCSDCSIGSTSSSITNVSSEGLGLAAFLGHASRHAHLLDESALDELYCDLVRGVVLEGDVRVVAGGSKTHHVVVRHGWLLVMDSKNKERVVQRVSLVDAATRLIPSSDEKEFVSLEVFRRQRAAFRLAELGFDSAAEAMVWQCAVHEGVFHAGNVRSSIGRRSEA